jgi:DNA modification methylase
MIQSRMYDFVEMDVGKSKREVVNGKIVNVKEGVFWIQKQRQMHSIHYVTPYQASFAPQIPSYFIERYSKKGDTVLDPFCGRGTTVFEANISGRIGIGVDISPLAIQIAKSKMRKVTYEQIENRLKEIDFSKRYIKEYSKFKDIYHKNIYSQIVNLKKQLLDNPIDNLIKAIILGRLHGHSPAFFSAFSFNVISISPEAFRKQNIKHGSKPEDRDVVPRILIKAKTILKDPIIEQPKSKLYLAKSTKLPLHNDSIDLIVTSPPFLSVINYIDDNWLRFWFLGYNNKDLEKLRKVLIQTDDLDEYKEFINKSMKEMYRVLKRDKYCIIEVGDVAHKSKKLNLDELIVELSNENNFEVKEILINHISSPKISKAFSKQAKEKGTKTNRCVIMKKR